MSDGGVVDEDIDPAEPFDRLPNDVIGDTIRSQITGNRQRPVSERCNDGIRAPLIASIHRYTGPPRVEALGRRTPESTRSTGDEHDAPGEVGLTDGDVAQLGLSR